MEPWQFFDGHKIKEHFDREVAYARRKQRILEAYQHTETQPVIDVRRLPAYPPTRRHRRASRPASACRALLSLVGWVHRELPGLTRASRLPPPPARLQPYPEEAIAERNQLLNEGFPDWKRQHFYGYLGAIRRYGRTDLAGVQQVMGEMGKAPEDVARYHEVFWRRGPVVFEKWTTMIDAVKRAENRAREIAKLERAVAAKVARCTRNPWDSEELVAGGRKLGKSQGIRTFTPEDDRALLCLVRPPLALRPRLRWLVAAAGVRWLP